jgi:hypothetical protein
MKTAMQELITELKRVEDYPMMSFVIKTANDLLEKEKEQIIDAHFNGMDKLATSLSEFLPIKHTMSVIQEIKNGGDIHEDGEQYYNQTYNQKQHIIDIMKADEDDGLYKMFDTDSDKKH